MTTEQLQEKIEAICQPIIDKYEDAKAEFIERCNTRSVLSAIEWQTDDVAYAAGMAGEAHTWLESTRNAIQKDMLSPSAMEHMLQHIGRERLYHLRINESTNRVSNVIEDYKQMGIQEFRRGKYGSWRDAPLTEIENVFKAYFGEEK